MTEIERAETYAAVFLKVGHRWPAYVPSDATVAGAIVHLGDIRMEPTVDGGWRLTQNGHSRVVRTRTAVAP
jgi:hypothetical protein